MKIKKEIKEYFFVMAGSFFIAFAVSVCLAPLKLSSGGISGIATIFLYTLKIPLSVTNIIANVLLFIIGFRELSKKVIAKTVLGILLLTLFLEICRFIPPYTEDVLAASVTGGVILGLGLGTVIKAGGSTGGSDLAGILMHKKIPYITVSNHILILDLVIIAIMAVIFGSITVAVYSSISLLAAIKVCDVVLSYGNAAKEIRIVSKKSKEIAQKILFEFKRGVTGVRCKGMYTGEDGLMIFCIVSPRQLPGIVSFIKTCDEKAFVTVSDMREVLGKGF